MDTFASADHGFPVCKSSVGTTVEHKLISNRQYFFISEFLYTFLVTLPKLSIVFFYLRIFSARAFQRRCVVVIVITALFGVTSTTVVALQCMPIQFIWDGWKGQQTAKCIQLHIEVYAYAAINILLDIVIFTLPIPQVCPRSLYVLFSAH